MVAEVQNFEHAARLSMASFSDDEPTATRTPFWISHYARISAFAVAVIGTGIIGFAFI